MQIRCKVYLFNGAKKPGTKEIIEQLPIGDDYNQLIIEFIRVKAPASESDFLVSF